MPQPNTTDCAGAPADNPLCQGTTQVNAKAYPGLRELAVLHGLGDQGIPASICPENASQPTNADGSPAPDYGYRPAVATIIDQLKGQLQQTCLPQRLTPDDGGNVPCVVLEAQHTGTGQLDCAKLPGRRELNDVDHIAIEAALQSDEAPAAPYEWDSFCEIVPLEGDPADHSSPIGQCQWREENEIDPSVSGWCYVDAGPPPVGNPELADLKSCPLDEKRLVRLVHDGNVRKGATAVVTCAGEGTF